MTSFASQLVELVTNGHFQLFLGLYVFTQAFWWLRVHIARKNKTYTQSFAGKYAVLVAVYHEDPQLFEACLKSITAHGKPAELIVTIDDAPNAPKRLKTLAQKYATTVIEVPNQVGKREQYALATEALKKKVDVIITVDSATVWDDTTINILKPFNDKQVGAVSGRQVIVNAERTWAGRAAAWFEDLRFSVTLPFQSYFGQATVIASRTLAARRTAFTQAAQFARNETFAGRSMASDDASITTHILSQGLRVVYQKDSLVHTAGPSTMRAFLRQYLRWYRGAYRRFFHSLGSIMRMHPLVMLSNIEFLLASFVYASVILTFIFKLAFRVYEFDAPRDLNAIIAIFTFLAVGFVVSNYIRSISHVNKRDLLFVPAFAVFSGVINVGLKVAAVFSFSENGRPARGKSAYGERSVGRARTAAALAGFVIVGGILPLGYITDVQPLGVPFSVITSQRGPEYYHAKQFAAQLADADTTNDPSDNHIAALIHANAAHYKHAVTHDLALDTVTCAKDALLEGDNFSINNLDYIDSCYQQTAARAQSEALAQEAKNAEERFAPVGVTVQAQPGDTLTYLVRAELKKRAPELSAAQAVFAETTYLAHMNQQGVWLEPGDSVIIDTTKLTELTAQAKTLTPEQTANWSYYAHNIVW